MTPIELGALESLKRDGRINQADLDDLQSKLKQITESAVSVDRGFQSSLIRSESPGLRNQLQNCLVTASFLDEGEVRNSHLIQNIIAATKMEQFKIIETQMENGHWEASYFKEFYLESASADGFQVFGSRLQNLNFSKVQIEKMKIETSNLSDWRMIHKSSLKDVGVTAVHWENMKLIESQMDQVIASVGHFKNLNFQRSQFYNLHFENFKMQDISIQESQLSKLNFRMRKNQFGIHRDECFRNIQIEKSSLNEINFLGNTWQNVRLKNLQLSGIEIKNTRLENCEIDGNEDFFEKLEVIESR